MGKTSSVTTLAGALLAFAMVAPAAARGQGPAAGQPGPMAPRGKCDPVLAKALPGDFNFCLAAKDWQAGRHAQATEFLQLAAGWGDKAAQMALGVAYFNGDGVPQDRALGLAWLGLAAERHGATASGLFASARSKVDAAEFARADTLYQQMRATYGDEVAAVRADKHYRRAVHALQGDPAYGMGRCVAGYGYVAFSDPGNREQNTGADKYQPCSMSSEHTMLAAIEQHYEVYIEGWHGRVTVGPVEAEKSKAAAKP
jgi:TPR repeat protein